MSHPPPSPISPPPSAPGTRSPLSALNSSNTRLNNHVGRIEASPMAAPEQPHKKRPAIRRWPSSAANFSFSGMSRFNEEAVASSPPPSSSSPGFVPSRLRMSISESSSEDVAAAVSREMSEMSLQVSSRETSSTSVSSSSLARRNSIAQTKTLFQRGDMRSASFSGPSGGDNGGDGAGAGASSAASTFRFDQHFVWGAKLGSGSFADVYLVTHKTRPSEQYAIKCYKGELKSRTERAERLKEAELANALPPHKNLCAYYRVWQDASLMYVQMELCERGTLRDQMGATPMHTAGAMPLVWRVTSQMACALKHVHAHGLIHCDVKPDNVLISEDGTYKLGDLGQATFAYAWDEHEGDARYIAKELLHHNPSPRADIFSFGIMLFELRSGKSLPGHGDEWEVLRTGAPVFPGDAGGATGTPELFTHLVQRMMDPDPDQRPNAAAVLDVCPWQLAAVAAAALPGIKHKALHAADKQRLSTKNGRSLMEVAARKWSALLQRRK